MFNLEQSIVDWRKQMLASGIQTPVPLEELEIHLREEIERQMKAGLSEQNSFELSVQAIGQAKPLKIEFKKSERTFMNRRLIILIGIVGLLLGTMMILPALGKHKQRNQATISTGVNFFNTKWAGDEAYGLELGTGFSIGGAGMTLYGLSRLKKRKA